MYFPPVLKQLQDFSAFPVSGGVDTSYTFEKLKAFWGQKRTFYDEIPKEIGNDFLIRISSKVFGRAAVDTVSEMLFQDDGFGEESLSRFVRDFLERVVPYIKKSHDEGATPPYSYDSALLSLAKTMEENRGFLPPMEFFEMKALAEKVFEAERAQVEELEGVKRDDEDPQFTETVLDAFGNDPGNEFMLERGFTIYHDEYMGDVLALQKIWATHDDAVDLKGLKLRVTTGDIVTPDVLSRLIDTRVAGHREAVEEAESRSAVQAAAKKAKMRLG